MSDLNRELELDHYRDVLTQLANTTSSTYPLKLSSDDYRSGFNVAITLMSGIAEGALQRGEALTGPGVDITAEERERAEAIVESLAPEYDERTGSGYRGEPQ